MNLISLHSDMLLSYRVLILYIPHSIFVSCDISFLIIYTSFEYGYSSSSPRVPSFISYLMFIDLAVRIFAILTSVTYVMVNVSFTTKTSKGDERRRRVSSLEQLRQRRLPAPWQRRSSPFPLWRTSSFYRGLIWLVQRFSHLVVVAKSHHSFLALFLLHLPPNSTLCSSYPCVSYMFKFFYRTLLGRLMSHSCVLCV